MCVENSKLSKWFKQTQKKGDAIISLYDAFLNAKLYQYIFYRFRYFTFYMLIISIAHIIEFYFLFYLLPPHHSLVLILYRIIAIMILSFWWGATEILRNRIREYRLAGDTQRIKKEISHWLILTTLFAMAIISIALIQFIAGILHPEHTDTFNLIYLSAVILNIAVMIIASTMHAALYALTRIAKPFIAVPAAQLFSLFLLIFTYPWLGMYALACSYILSAIFGFTLTIYYILRMNKLFDILPTPYWQPKGFLDFIRKLPYVELLFASLAGLMMGSQNMWIYYFIRNIGSHQSYIIIIMFFLISPQLHNSHNWVNLIYFDYKRLNSPIRKILSQQYKQILLSTALIIPLGMWILSATILILFFGLNISLLLLMLLFMYVLYSYQSIKAMEHFTHFYYLDVIIVNSLTMIAVLCNQYFPHDIYIRMMIICVILIIGCLYIYTIRTVKTKAYASTYRAQEFIVWLATVKSWETPCCLITLTLSRQINNHIKKQMITHLRHIGNICFLSKNKCYIGTQASLDTAALYQDIVKHGFGYIENIHIYPTSSNGHAAIKMAFNDKSEENTNDRPLTKEACIQAFYHRYPKGDIFHLSTMSALQGNQIDYHQRTQIIAQAFSYLTIPFHLGTCPTAFVTSLPHGVSADVIFVLPKTVYHKADYYNWSKFIFYQIVHGDFVS